MIAPNILYATGKEDGKEKDREREKEYRASFDVGQNWPVEIVKLFIDNPCLTMCDLVK